MDPVGGGQVEHKVTASTFGAGAGVTVAGFVNWVLAEYVFHEPAPLEVQAFVLLLVTVAGAFGAGYLAPHTSRAGGGRAVQDLNL